MSCTSQKKKKVHLFCLKKSFISFVFYPNVSCIEKKIQNIYTFTYQKTLVHALLLFIFKIVESLQCISYVSSVESETTPIMSFSQP